MSSSGRIAASFSEKDQSQLIKIRYRDFVKNVEMIMDEFEQHAMISYF